nr:MAG: capsid protein [Cressdnaviricota sp.]
MNKLISLAIISPGKHKNAQMVLKHIKRAVRRVGRKAYNKLKKRYVSKSGVRIGQIYKDVMHLKSLVNTEKKRLDLTSPTGGSSLYVGQINNTGPGYQLIDITPIPSEGVTYSQRSGASVKLVSSYMKFQFLQQNNTHQAMRFKIMFVLTKGTPETVGNIASDMMLPNSFTGLIDYHSMRNPDKYGDYQVLRTVHFMIPADNYTGTGASNQTRIKDLSIGMKWMRGKGHHIRFNGDTNNVTNGQITMFILADSGNVSTITGLFSNVATNYPSTGSQLNYDIKHYYVDN